MLDAVEAEGKKPGFTSVCLWQRSLLVSRRLRL